MAHQKANLVQVQTTTTGTGTYTIGATVAGNQGIPSSWADGDTADWKISDGTNWEVARLTLGGSKTTLARTTILESSNSNLAVSWSAGTKTMAVVYPASKAVTTDGVETLTNKTLTSPTIAKVANLTSNGLVSTSGGDGTLGVQSTDNSLCNCRLTLSSGNPVYSPTVSVAVSGQDTTAETITVTAHGWTVGTMVSSSAASGGINSGVVYYVGNPTTNTVTLHTTVADAVAGTNKVNITGSVSATIYAWGVANSTLYITPYKGNRIALYDGSGTWNIRSFSELSITLSGLTSGLPYDVFVYDNSGTPAARALVAWTSATARATALVMQDGVLVKSGATTDRYIGTIYTTSTSTTEDSGGGYVSNVGGKRFVWNYYNRVPRNMSVTDGTSSWSYTTGTWRQARANAGNQVEYIAGLSEDSIAANLQVPIQALNNSARAIYVSIGYDGTTQLSGSTPFFQNASATSFIDASLVAHFVGPPGLGYHKLVWCEYGGDGTSTFFGTIGAGGSAALLATMLN